MNNSNYSIFPNTLLFSPARQGNFIDNISKMLEENNLDGYNKEDIEVIKVSENSVGWHNIYFNNKETENAIIVDNQCIEEFKKLYSLENMIGSKGVLLKKGKDMCAVLIENSPKY